MEYRNTLSSAQQFAKNGILEDWVHSCLLSDANNKEFSNGLKLFYRYFLGPIKCLYRYFLGVVDPKKT